MRFAPLLLLVTALAGCAPSAPPTTAREACERQADDDPAVKLALGSAAALPEIAWQSEGKPQALRQQALARCLEARGGGVRGGVERPR